MFSVSSGLLVPPSPSKIIDFSVNRPISQSISPEPILLSFTNHIYMPLIEAQFRMWLVATLLVSIPLPITLHFCTFTTVHTSACMADFNVPRISFILSANAFICLGSNPAVFFPTCVSVFHFLLCSFFSPSTNVLVISHALSRAILSLKYLGRYLECCKQLLCSHRHYEASLGIMQCFFWLESPACAELLNYEYYRGFRHRLSARPKSSLPVVFNHYIPDAPLYRLDQVLQRSRVVKLAIVLLR